jgi:hypothetical protein
MSERSDLSSMVALKENHIQELEREKGELLRKLLATNCLRLNLTEVATPSSNSAGNQVSSSAENNDSEQTIFQLTEKVKTIFMVDIKYLLH